MRSSPAPHRPETAPAEPEQGTVAAIAMQLEEDIVLGRLHPRERLVEQELAERFGTHRAAVRQALFELDAKGIIERIPNRGAIVRDLSPEDVQQIYEVRAELETMAARIIPLPVSPADLKRLGAIQKVHSRAVDTKDLRTVFYSNLEFHRLMFGLCGNRFLIEAIEQLVQKTYGIRSYSNAIPMYLQQVRADHVEMLDALRHGNRKELIRLVQQHLRPSQDTYIRAYRQRFGGGEKE